MAMIPTTVYERGKLAGGALLGGQVDAATAAIFAPMELSPSELQGIRDRLTGHNKYADNPFIKTILDTATNPIVMIGAFLALGPWGKVMNIKQLSALMSEGTGYTRAVSPLMRGLVSPITSLREIWNTGWFNHVLDIMRHTSLFFKEMLPRAGEAAKAAELKLGRKLTDREWVQVHAYVEDWHKAVNPLSTSWHKKYPILREKPLAPGLERAMAPEVKELAQNLRENVLKPAWSYHPKEEWVRNIETGLMESKGIEQVGEGYMPHIMPRSSIESLAGIRGMARKAYERQLRNTVGTPARITNRAYAGSIPNLHDLELIQDLVDPDAMRVLKGIPSDLFSQFYDAVKLNMSQFQKVLASKEPFVVEAKGVRTTVAPKEALEMMKRRTVSGFQELFGMGQDIAEGVTDQIVKAARSGRADVAEDAANVLARRLSTPPMYTLNPRISIPKYLRGLGPLWAWFGETVPGMRPLGLQLDDIFSQTNLGKGREWMIDMYTDHIRPGLRGLLTPKEFSRRLWFASMTEQAKQWLNGPSTIVKAMPQAAKNWMLKTLEGGGLSEHTIGGRISSLLYVSSLGANMSPVSKNLFQNWITTANFVGPINMLRGARQVTTGLGQLTKRLAAGGSMDDAFKAAFPEYYRVLGHEHILEGMTAGDIAKESAGISSAMTGVWGKTKAVLMGPFSGSEKLNRLLAFYSSRAAAVQSGLPPEASDTISRNLTLMTQFGGGSVGIPSGIRDMPVPLRQFAHFPLRMLEWLYGSMAMHPADNPLNPRSSFGTIGRTMVGSTAIYEIFKNLMGVDVSSALAFSALPQPTFENAPLYPLPIVPPAVSVAADIAKGVGSGNWEGVAGRTAAMLTPGGLAARRAIRTWSPRYVDYGDKQPDGTLPVYNKDGYLIRMEKPISIVLRGLGIQPANITEEMAATQYLLKQRDKVRQYRREYIGAIIANNMDKAQRIQDDFHKKYPDLGPIKVKKQDMKYAMGQREVSRIQRILKGMPAAYRPVFEDVAGVAMANDFGATLNGATGLE